MDFESWAAFVAASCVVLAIPGPMVLLVVTSALRRGPRTALPLAVGTMMGDATMMTLAALGAGSLLALDTAFYAGLQWVGAGYLAWLGFGFWRSASAAPPAPEVGEGGRLARRAWLAVVTNPLTVTFFVAFLPQFIDPARDYWTQVILLEATFMALAFANTLAYARAAAWMGAVIAAPLAARAVQRGGGAALVSLGIWLMVASA